MFPPSTSGTRLAVFVFRAAALLVVVLAPTVFFSVKFEYVKGHMITEAHMTAGRISEMVGRYPTLWEYRRGVLEEVMEGRYWAFTAESRRVLSKDGRVVAENRPVAAWPALNVSSVIYDAGLVVGRVELSQSVGQLLGETFLVLIAAGLAVGLCIHAFNRFVVAKLHQAEAVLREAELRFRTLFEESPSSVVILGGTSETTIDANRRAAKLFGCTREELIKDGLVVFLSGETRKEISDGIAQAEEGRGSFERNGLTAWRKDGSDLLISVYGRRIPLGGAWVTYCTLFDVTDRLNLYEIWSTNMQQLIRADKMTFLGTMASGFAHDINNPNQQIRMNLPMIERFCGDALSLLESRPGNHEEIKLGGIPLGEVRESMPRMFGDIRAGSERIAQIIRSLMSYAQEDRTVSEEDVNVDLLVEGCLDLLRHRIAQSTDRFAYNPGTNFPPVRGKHQHLEQVLTNLIVNALESLPEKDCGVTVSTEFRVSSAQVCITVTDEGSGMSPEVLARVREPFFTTKHTQGGTGLGLAISNFFVKEHGGELLFRSELGKGTKAVVCLPAARNG